MNAFLYIVIIIIIVISINYSLIMKANFKSRQGNYWHRIILKFYNYFIVLFFSIFLYILLLSLSSNLFWKEAILWIWIYPLLLLFYWVRQKKKKKKKKNYTIINDILLWANWLLIFSIFIKCYTSKWDISEVNLAGFLGILLYCVLSIIIHSIIKKWSWFYLVIAIFLFIQVYLYLNWYIFNLKL